MERECETISAAAPAEILVFPFPGQSHMCPMVQLSKRLAAKGLRVTVVATISAANSIHQTPPAQAATANSFQVEFISDGSEEENKSENLDEAVERFKSVATQTLTQLIISIQNQNKNTSSSDGASSVPLKLKLVIYDSGMPWVLDIARQLGIDGAPFFTQSCAVASIYHHFREGAFKLSTTTATPTPSSLDGDSEAAAHGSTSPPSTDIIVLPSMPPLKLNDLPSFLCDTHSYAVLCKHTLNQFSNFREAKWQLYNTFDTLEPEVVKWMTSQSWQVKTVGPTIPSMFLDRRFEDDKDYSFNLFKPNVETYVKWLDSKEAGSVVYLSFGSFGSLKREQMEEIAWGLKKSDYHFMWVVRESEKEKLPKNFIEELSDSTEQKGLVVSWCSQLQVLAHKALGCFVTHCGWNSTLEALSLGAPMVAMPQWTDQTTNAKFVEDVWKAGVRVRVDEKLGVATKEELAKCIRQVMEEEKGAEIRKALSNWKKLAKEAVDKGEVPIKILRSLWHNFF